MIRLVDVVGSELEPQTNSVVVNFRGAVISGDGDETDSNFAQGELFGSLGVTARPFGADERGNAEALVDDSNNISLSLRDPRIGVDLYGEMDPGDTCIHATDPTQSARMIFKGQDRQVVIVVKKKNGKELSLSIGGDEEAFTVAANGSTLNMADDGTCSFLSKFGSGIICDASGVWVKGASVKLGAKPNQALNKLIIPSLVTTCPAGSGSTAPMPVATHPGASSIILTIP